MTATSQPTLDTLPDMHNVAAIIAQDARENQAGVDVISATRRGSGPLPQPVAPAAIAVTAVVG